MSDTVKITSCKMETKDTKTFEFVLDKKARAGQFVMVWVPGVDEIPMSLSSVGDVKSITVRAVGKATNAIHELKEGDMIGLRGPYGNGFNIPKGCNLLVIGGGTGMAAVMPIIRETGADTIIGARSASEVLMEPEIRRHSENVWISTDDGSAGFRGNAVELMKEKMEIKKYDLVLACGPEVMLYHVYKTCSEMDIKCQLSLERFMKCGAGLCGSCVIDGMRVCEDGPVFDSGQIKKMKEFGKVRRDSSGAKIWL